MPKKEDKMVAAKTQYARSLDEKIRSLHFAASRAWVQIALWCLEFHEQELYRCLGFVRFDDWATDRFGKSRSTLREAMRIVEGLEPQIPAPELVQITRQNCEILLTLPEKRRVQPAVLRAAKECTEVEFKKFLNGPKEEKAEGAAGGGDLDLVTEVIVVERGVKELIEKAVDIAKRVAKTESDNIAWEFIATDIINTWETAEVDYEGLPRRDIRTLRREVLTRG